MMDVHKKRDEKLFAVEKSKSTKYSEVPTLQHR